MVIEEIYGEVAQLENEPEVVQIGESPKNVPFAIPEKWKWIQFSNAVKVISSRPFQIKAKEVLEQGTYPVISQSKEKIDGFCNDENKLIPESELPLIIFGDHTRILKYIDYRFVVGADGTKLLRVKTPAIDPKYFYIVLQSMIGQTRKRGYSRHFQFLKALHVPVPPIEEQCRIVQRLEKICPLVDTYGKEQEAQEKLDQELPEKLRAAILQEAIQGKLVPQLESEPKVELQNEKESFEIPFEIPSKWKWTTLEQICLQITDGEHKTPKYQIGGVPFLSVKDISSKKLNFSNTKFVSLEDFNVIKKRCYPQKGDILLSKVGSTGIPAIVDTDKEFALFVSVALLKLNKLLVLDKFLWYLLQSPLVQKQAKENTRGIGNKNWVLKAIKATMVPLPPILEQHRIVDQLEKIFSSINSLSK